MKTYSQKFLKQRKFFMVLPILALPFITLLFWALGGGNADDVKAQQPTVKGGLNLDLPDANLKDDKSLDKLSYYEKAASDSVKLEELMKNDPYYKQHKYAETDRVFSNDTTLPLALSNAALRNRKNKLNPSPYSSHTYTDPNEAKVYKKLNELNTALNGATAISDKKPSYSNVSPNNNASVNSADIDRLEQMMDMTKDGSSGEDAEMKQLNGMMEKILYIQHPERVQEKVRQTSETHKGQVFAVTGSNNNDQTSLLVNDKKAAFNTDTVRRKQFTNGFYFLQDDVEDNVEPLNAIPAVIHETQTLVDGAVVKLRLLNDIYINGVLIPKDNFVFGIASVKGERVNIQINSIRYRNSLFPVQLSVYDIDGIDGIYIPGAITRDVAKSSVDRAVQGIGITALDPSVGAQAAGAGIEAAKTLLSRKTKLIKVTVKAGYHVLLLDQKQKSS